MKFKLLLLNLVVFTTLLYAQEDSVSNPWKIAPQVELMGYVDVFYAYDFNQPATGKRQNFIYNFNRHNEFNVNLGLIQLDLKHKKYRSTLAFQTGTYPQDNYSPEQELMSNINTASVGINLDKKNKLWLDAGVFPSNLGFESALSIKNWTLSRSLVAESSPYYLAGAKLNFKASDKWSYTLLISNGWQKIMRTPNNSLPSFGTQVFFTPKANLELNWSTYVGREIITGTNHMRYFNNLYAILNKEKRWSWILGFDLGYQSDQGTWGAPVAISRVKLNANSSLAFRVEYFYDPERIIIQQPFSASTEIFGCSVNYDYRPVKNVALRLEARYFDGGQNFYFSNANGAYANNFSVLASLAIQLNKRLK